MTAMKGWFKVSDNILGDPKLMQCSGPAQLAFFYGLAFCSRQRTDGLIIEEALPQICQGFPQADIKLIAQTLIRFGLWKKHKKGYIVKNYLVWQSSRKQIEAALKANAERQERYREKMRALGSLPGGE
jgi:hypothetical protein